MVTEKGSPSKTSQWIIMYTSFKNGTIMAKEREKKEAFIDHILCAKKSTVT